MQEDFITQAIAEAETMQVAQEVDDLNREMSQIFALSREAIASLTPDEVFGASTTNGETEGLSQIQITQVAKGFLETVRDLQKEPGEWNQKAVAEEAIEAVLAKCFPNVTIPHLDLVLEQIQTIPEVKEIFDEAEKRKDTDVSLHQKVRNSYYFHSAHAALVKLIPGFDNFKNREHSALEDRVIDALEAKWNRGS